MYIVLDSELLSSGAFSELPGVLHKSYSIPFIFLRRPGGSLFNSYTSLEAKVRLKGQARSLLHFSLPVLCCSTISISRKYFLSLPVILSSFSPMYSSNIIHLFHVTDILLDDRLLYARLPALGALA